MLFLLPFEVLLELCFVKIMVNARNKKSEPVNISGDSKRFVMYNDIFLFSKLYLLQERQKLLVTRKKKSKIIFLVPCWLILLIAVPSIVILPPCVLLDII